MTLSEFKRDISTRRCCHTSLINNDKTLPIEAVMHISEVIVEEEYPAVILFADGVNKIQLTQIQSIDLHDGCYSIVCGDANYNRIIVTVFFES